MSWLPNITPPNQTITKCVFCFYLRILSELGQLQPFWINIAIKRVFKIVCQIETWTWSAFVLSSLVTPPSSYLLGSFLSTARKTVPFSVWRTQRWCPAVILTQPQWHKITFLLRSFTEHFLPHFSLVPDGSGFFLYLVCPCNLFLQVNWDTSRNRMMYSLLLHLA